MPEKKVNIMVAEDQGLILHSIVRMLETVPDFHIMGTACNGLELLEILKKDKPDIILMDIKMPKMGGLEVTRIIDSKMPWIKIIALSAYDHPNFIKELLKSGAKGFLSKSCTFEELCDAIRSVHAGKTYLCNTASQIVVNHFAQSATDEQTEFHSLTSREIEIIQFLAEGHMTRAIASKLFISEKTVERHKTNIFKKLQVKNTAHLIRLAVEQGLLLS
jgi:two-component system, NarL family, response regulator NreC